MSTLLISWTVLLPLPPLEEPQISRQQLISLMEGARGEWKDYSFFFEGKSTVLGEAERQSQKLGPDGVQFTYSGTYSRRSDRAVRVESYFFNHRTDTAGHYLVSKFDNTLTVSARSESDEKAEVTIREPGIEDFKRIGSFGQILLADAVIGYALSSYVYRFEGFEQVDGHNCIKVRFLLTQDESLPLEKAVSDVFWIDLQRGGHVLRHERHFRTDVASATTNIRLESFETPEGIKVWLPVQGQVEGRITRSTGPNPKRIYSKDPILIEAYHLVPTSLKLNQGLTDKDFTVQPKIGDLVSDHLKKAQYEFGQYVIRSKEPKARPLTNAELETKLETMLGDANIMAGELKATSVERRGTTWLQRTPWIVGGLAALISILLLIRRQISA